jgi:putative FmdB family regulatory protein
MPLYEYRCRDCGHQFEIQQSITDDALTTCDRCRGDLRKVFQPVGIAFKGSGFYKTDSRGSSSTSSGAGSTGTGSTTSESSTSSSGDSSGSSGSGSSGGSTSGSATKAPAGAAND